MRFLMIFILVPLLLLASPDHVLNVHARHYNFFHLVLRWPPTFCRYKHCNVACKTPYKNNFTIHGMWPMKTYYERTPGNSHTFPFNQSAMTPPLVEKLRTSWPALRQGYEDMCFWQTGWNNHGSGSASRQKEDWQENYFTYANQHFTTLSLGDLGLTPGNSYSLQAIKDAIKERVQSMYVPAAIECCQDPKSNVSTLYQIRFCISKDGKSITDETKLPGCGKYRGICPLGEDILFPENPPTAVM